MREGEEEVELPPRRFTSPPADRADETGNEFDLVARKICFRLLLSCTPAVVVVEVEVAEVPPLRLLAFTLVIIKVPVEEPMALETATFASLTLPTDDNKLPFVVAIMTTG